MPWSTPPLQGAQFEDHVAEDEAQINAGNQTSSTEKQIKPDWRIPTANINKNNIRES